MRTLAVQLVFFVAWLAVAPQTARAQSPAELQQLLNDTAAQLQLAYRQNVPEHRHRYEQLSRAVGEWRAAERSEANNRLLAEWLRGAIRRSMPGSRESLPPLPSFRRRPRPPAIETASPDKSTGDPFADDPQ